MPGERVCQHVAKRVWVEKNCVRLAIGESTSAGCRAPICHVDEFGVYLYRKRMPSGGGPGLQSRAGGNCLVPGGFDSHPFRYKPNPDENHIFYLPSANTAGMFYHRSVVLALYRSKEKPAMKGWQLVVYDRRRVISAVVRRK
jgi:hypothetical protein